jgi:hypothetical protein
VFAPEAKLDGEERGIAATICTFGQLELGSVFYWIPRGESISPGAGRFVKRCENRALETNTGQYLGFGADELVLVRTDDQDIPTPMPPKAMRYLGFDSGPLKIDEIARRLLTRKIHRPSPPPPPPAE